MAPLAASGVASSRVAGAASRCRRPSSKSSGYRLFPKRCDHTPDARFGSTLLLHGPSSAPNLHVDITAVDFLASMPTAGHDSGSRTGRKSLKKLVTGQGGHESYSAAGQVSSADKALLSYGPRRAASAGSLRAWTPTSAAGSKKNNHPRCLLPGGRLKAVAKVPRQAHSRPGLGASLQQPPPGRRGKELGAAALFDEVIRCDRTYGPILAEIKAAYEMFLGDRGASVPEDPIAVVGFATGGSTASDARPSAKRSSERHNAELAVDAARRQWTDPEDMTSRGDYAKESELERENAAVRALVQRLRTDLQLENARENDRKRQDEFNAVEQQKLHKVQQVPAHNQNWQRVAQEPDAAQASPAPMPVKPALPVPAKPALPIPIRGFQVKVSQQAAGGAQSGRWSSARSSSASTISVRSVDDSQLWPLGLWAARQTPPGPTALQATRPLEVPTLDLSRISWLIDEASEGDEGYYEDSDGGQGEITPPPVYAADTE